jgi:hypothetical protein
MNQRPAASELPRHLASDHDSAYTAALKSRLLWQADVLAAALPAVADADTRRRLRWQCDALAAGADVLPRVRRTLARRAGGQLPQPAHPVQPAQPVRPVPAAPPEPSLQLLMELGWLAWDAREEAHALRILGGVGGFAEGPMGRAMFQASAYLEDRRSADAARLLDDAIQRYGDPQGEASGALALLWLSLDDGRWSALARRVASSSRDPAVREMCAATLNSDNACAMRPYN